MKRHRITIETPFLRHFIAFYGNFGLHLRPVSRANPASFLNLFFSSGLIIFLNVCMFSLLKNQLQMSEYFMHQNRKPLFAMALSSISLLSPYIFNISMTYFLLKGGQISRLLDSKCFSSRAMPSFLNHRWTVPVFFLVDQTSFLYLFMQYIVGFQENFHFFYSIIMYYTNQVPAVLFRLITYYKFCTWKALVAIEMSSAAESELVMNKVSTLATVNRQLNCLFSPPLFLFTVFHAMQMLTLMCGVFSRGFDVNGFLVFLYIFAYLLSICFFCQQIEFSLGRITKTDHLLKALFNASSSQKLNSADHSTTTTKFHLHHLPCIYGNNMQLQIFSIFTFSSSFLMALTLFLLNYAILLVQTK